MGALGWKLVRVLTLIPLVPAAVLVFLPLNDATMPVLIATAIVIVTLLPVHIIASRRAQGGEKVEADD